MLLVIMLYDHVSGNSKDDDDDSNDSDVVGHYMLCFLYAV